MLKLNKYYLYILMKGGLFINPNNVENIVVSYLENSDISKLSKGAYGLTFRTELRIGSVLPEYFLNLDVGEDFKRNIRELVVKLCVINTNNNEDNEIKNFHRQRYGNVTSIIPLAREFIKNNLDISPVNRDDFIKEVNIQTDIYLKTISYLQPLCPGIGYANILIDDRFRNPSGSTNINQRILNLLNIPYCTKQELNYGIIVMEMASGYITLHEEIKTLRKGIETNPKKKTVIENDIAIGLFMLIQLALQTGYTHGDFHFGNLLINDNYTKYFSIIEKRVLIIDFGRAMLIPPAQLEAFKQLCIYKNYTGALQILCVPPVANKYISNIEHNPFYGWVCDMFNYGIYSTKDKNKIKLYNDTINKRIDSCFILRQKQIDQNIVLMRDLHEQISEYPEIPLSDSSEENLFRGFIENIEAIPNINTNETNLNQQEQVISPIELPSGEQLSTPIARVAIPIAQVGTPIEQVLEPIAQVGTPTERVLEPPQIQRKKPIRKQRQTGGNKTNRRRTNKRRTNRRRTNRRRTNRRRN